MKIYISMLLIFFAGLMSVNATSANSAEGVTVTKQTVATAKKTVKVNWSTLKCEKYSLNGSANYFVKSLGGTWYKIKNKNWDCIGNSAKYKYDVKNCVCKILYPDSSGGGDDDDDNGVCKQGAPGCGGGTTGGDDGGATTAGTTGGDDGGATTGSTSGGDVGGGETTAGATTGATTGGETTAGTTTGPIDL
ncbi:hypothetical protein K2X05_12825 [bacterium]|nr:hypothetical protein [bacterium]